MPTSPYKGVTAGGISGLIQGLTVTNVVSTEEATNATGVVISRSHFNSVRTIVIDLITGATAQPVVGATFTVVAATSVVVDSVQIGGVYDCVSVEIKQANNSYQRATIGGKRWVAGALP